MTEELKKEIRQFFGIQPDDELTLKATYQNNCPPGARTEEEMYEALYKRMQLERGFIFDEITRSC